MSNTILFDTHCHIHDSSFFGANARFSSKDPDLMIKEAAESGVKQLICVGTDVSSSQQAVTFCSKRESCYASVALHPHEAAQMSEKELVVEMDAIKKLFAKQDNRVVAIGECGLDYFYHDDPATHRKQKLLLRQHFKLAVEHGLPMIFHIRNANEKKDDPSTRHAFDEFFSIFDEYDSVKGVVHSFSATQYELEESLKRGLFIGLNGIMTFTKDSKQLEAAKSVPLEKLVLETDAPFLTPAPYRGKMCEPKHLEVTAQFLSKLRGESFDELALATTQNARLLFGI